MIEWDSEKEQIAEQQSKPPRCWSGPIVSLGIQFEVLCWRDHARGAALRGRLFDYNQSAPLDVKVTKTELRDGIEVRDITFANTSGGRTAAYLVVPSPKALIPQR